MTIDDIFVGLSSTIIIFKCSSGNICVLITWLQTRAFIRTQKPSVVKLFSLPIGWLLMVSVKLQ